MGKIKFPHRAPTDFELGGTAADIQRRGGGEREGGRGTKQRKEASRKENTHSAEKGVAEKRARTNKSDTKMDTEGGGEKGTSQSHSKHKGT